MKKTLMKSKFYIGIALLIQAFSMMILFFSQMRKRKSLAAAFAAIAAVAGTAGAFLAVTGAHEEDEKNEVLDALMDDYFEISDDDIYDQDDAVYCTGRDADDVADDSDETEPDEWV